MYLLVDDFGAVDASFDLLLSLLADQFTRQQFQWRNPGLDEQTSIDSH